MNRFQRPWMGRGGVHPVGAIARGLLGASAAAGGMLGLGATLIAPVGGCGASQAGSESDSGLAVIDPRDSEAMRSFDPVIDRSPWTYAGSEGWMLTTPNYKIFTTEQGPLVSDRIPAFLELALAQYRTALGELPGPKRGGEGPLETYILASRSQWATLTRQLTGERASTYLKIQAGGYAERGRAVLFDIGDRHTFSVAAHEGWHQYTQRVMEHPLPVWLEEGIAAYMEGFRWNPDAPARPIFLPWANVERFDRLRDLVSSGRALPLETLLSSRPQDLLSIYSNEDALDYYAQVWALVHFLREGAGGRYRDTLTDVLRDASRGTFGRRLGMARGRRDTVAFFRTRTGTLPFEVYFTDDLDRASAEYERFLGSIVKTGARDRIVNGRSPIDLP